MHSAARNSNEEAIAFTIVDSVRHPEAGLMTITCPPVDTSNTIELTLRPMLETSFQETLNTDGISLVSFVIGDSLTTVTKLAAAYSTNDDLEKIAIGLGKNLVSTPCRVTEHEFPVTAVFDEIQSFSGAMLPDDEMVLFNAPTSLDCYANNSDCVLLDAYVAADSPLMSLTPVKSDTILIQEAKAMVDTSRNVSSRTDTCSGV